MFRPAIPPLAMRLLLLALPALLAVGAAAQPAVTTSTRTVRVTGDAEVLVVPDEVVLRLGIETFDADLQTSTSTTETRVAAVIAAAEARGVSEEHIQTDYVRVEPLIDERRFNDEMRYQVYGYRARRSVVVTLRDLSQFDALLREAVAAGATYVHGIDFRTNDLRAQRDEARLLAIDAARDKAEALAGRLGQTVGAPTWIHEDWNRHYNGYHDAWAQGPYAQMSQNVSVVTSGPAPDDGPTAPGQIAVRARVSVTFALVD